MLQVTIERGATLAEGVVENVRAMVRDGRLQPGELYSVQQIAERLGVSRSPAREGLLRLAESGLVRFERNRGFRVVVPQARDIAEIFAVRLALEPAAAAREARTGAVAEQLSGLLAQMHRTAAAGDEEAFWSFDRALHGLLLDGNARAAQVVADLRSATRLLGARTSASRSLTLIAQEHEPIVAAVADRDPVAAERAMREHLERTGRLLVADDDLWDEVVTS
jgi:DNA-binding GntR family transcriptional regulator